MSSALEIAADVRAGRRSARDVVEEHLARIDARESEIHAFNLVMADEARAAADAVDASDDRGPLAGVPVAIKDNMTTRGIPTTCSSKILEGWRPPYDATAVQRLRAAGAVIVGKTNLDEFAMGSSTENSAFGPTRNPHDVTRVPGGSSGGSAAAVAAGFASVALGSETGGSVRQPAALCGVVGVKPTYGLVSRYGLIAFASSLDRIGPFANSVKDVAAVLQAIAGRDANDSTSTTAPVPIYTEEITRSVRGMRLGIPSDYFAEGMDRGVRDNVEKGIELLKKLGCQPVDIRMPHTDYAIAAYYIIATAEASSNLARYDGVRYGRRVDGDSLIGMYRKTRGAGFGAEVKRRIVLGTYVLSAGYYDAYYLKGQRVRALIAQDFREAFQKVDAIVTPTSPIPAFKLGEKADDPLQMYLADIYTVTGSLAGIPGISVPCGRICGTLPVGLQLFGPPFGESAILRLAHAFEQAGGAVL